MRILHIITRLDPGGSSSICLDMVDGLRKKGFDVSLACGRTKGDIPPDAIRIGNLRREVSPVRDFLAFFEIFLILKKLKPEILHLHSSKAGLLGRLAGRLSGVPVIFYQPHGNVFYGYFGKFKHFLIWFSEKLAASLADKIIALTEVGKNEFLKFGIARKEKFAVLHNGIPAMTKMPLPPKDEILKKLKIPSGKKYLTVVGRLEPVKGHGVFLDAFSRISQKFPQAVALLAGDGSLRKFLEKHCEKQELREKVFFLGFRDDIDEIISVSDVLVLPSLNEGFGIAILEAYRQKVPVVASAVGGLPEVVKDGETGILFPPADPVALASACEKLLSDFEWSRRMGDKGRKFFEENFTKEKMIDKLVLLYEKELKVKR